MNVQPLISADEQKDGVSVAFEGSLELRRGNTDLLSVSGSAITQYRSGRHLAFILARGEYGERDDAAVVSKDLEHARYRVNVLGPLAGEVFIQHDRDAFRRLALRALVGGGPRLTLIRSKELNAALGVSYLLEYEQLAVGDEADSGQGTLAHRLSNYLVLSTHVTEVLDLGVTMYVQPRLDKDHDVRVLCETSLLSKAGKHLSLKLMLTSAYDSEPPIGVVPLDTTLKGALQASF